MTVRGMPQIAVNPATERRIASFAETTDAELDRVLDRARRAQRDWGRQPVRQRLPLLRALARTLLRERDTLAALITSEMGKPIGQARAEIEKSAALCDYCVRHGAALLSAERPPAAPPEAEVVFDPLGTILAIMPWNFPVWQVMRAAVPALLAGNAMVLKHASNVPGCALAIAGVFRQAGFPRGLFQTVLASGARISGLISDHRIHGITLTGSTDVGKKVAAWAGAALKPAVLELGGSDPAIVLADADIERAAEICAHARLLNSGQSCVCAKRFIVVRSALARFEREFVARMAARSVGDPMDPATHVGPLARSDLRDQLHDQVKRSLAAGARLVSGGQLTAGRGYFYPPTVLTGVRPGMPAFEEELFGPVAAIIPARDESHAIALANRSRFGLGATLFTRNVRRGKALAHAIEAGAVFVNEFVRSSPELPFGGVKESGFGRELGPWGARAFTNVKTVWIAQKTPAR